MLAAILKAESALLCITVGPADEMFLWMLNSKAAAVCSCWVRIYLESST